MSRVYKLYLQDILKAVQNIRQFTDGIDAGSFESDTMRVHSVLYNLMVIGEAVKNIPPDLRSRVPDVEWRDIQRFRDKLVHHYFSIDTSIVWEIVQDDLTVLYQQIEKLLGDFEDEDQP